MHPEIPSDPTPLYFDLDGTRLAYTDEGSGASVVVAIPGLPGSKRDFRWLAAALAPHCRFVRLDPPGFGDSPREGYRPMNVADRAVPVLRLMDELELERAVLLGHSSGATVATHIAHRFPERVQACALLAPPAPTHRYPVRVLRVAAQVLRLRLGRLLLEPVQGAIYRALGFPGYLSEDELTYTTLDASADEFHGYAQTLAAVRQPVLLAWARDDRLIPASGYDEIERLAPEGPRLPFDTGGHNIQKTRALEIASAMAELLGPSRALP